MTDSDTHRRIYGIQSVVQILRTRPELVEKIFLQDDLGRGRRRRLAPDLKRRQCELEKISDQALTELAGTARHQGIVAEVSVPAELDHHEAIERIQAAADPLILILDGVQDPRNLGACLRTAEAVSVDLVVLPRSRSTQLTPAVSRTAAGGAELVSVARVANLARFMTALGEIGVRCVGADAAGDESLFQQDLTGPLALALGAEDQGLRRLTRERCDQLAHLPMVGGVASLNVSVAAGVCLYEAMRQRRSALAPPGGLG